MTEEELKKKQIRFNRWAILIALLLVVGGIVPAVATAGGIGVDGDEDDVAGAEDLADGVYAAAALGEGDVLLLRHEEHMDPFIEKNSFLIY